MKRTDFIKEMERSLKIYKGFKIEEITESTKSVVASIYTTVYLVDKYKRDKRKNITGFEVGEALNAYMASTLKVLEVTLSTEIGVAGLNQQLDKILERY